MPRRSDRLKASTAVDQPQVKSEHQNSSSELYQFRSHDESAADDTVGAAHEDTKPVKREKTSQQGLGYQKRSTKRKSRLPELYPGHDADEQLLYRLGDVSYVGEDGIIRDNPFPVNAMQYQMSKYQNARRISNVTEKRRLSARERVEKRGFARPPYYWRGHWPRTQRKAGQQLGNGRTNTNETNDPLPILERINLPLPSPLQSPEPRQRHHNAAQKRKQNRQKTTRAKRSRKPTNRWFDQAYSEDQPGLSASSGSSTSILTQQHKGSKLRARSKKDHPDTPTSLEATGLTTSTESDTLLITMPTTLSPFSSFAYASNAPRSCRPPATEPVMRDFHRNTFETQIQSSILEDSMNPAFPALSNGTIYPNSLEFASHRFPDPMILGAYVPHIYGQPAPLAQYRSAYHLPSVNAFSSSPALFYGSYGLASADSTIAPLSWNQQGRYSVLQTDHNRAFNSSVEQAWWGDLSGTSSFDTTSSAAAGMSELTSSFDSCPPLGGMLGDPYANRTHSWPLPSNFQPYWSPMLQDPSITTPQDPLFGMLASSNGNLPSFQSDMQTEEWNFAHSGP